ncbi:MAG: hypothetical protein B7Y41_04570 [Hydrogenophilales bacterium 28-61-23]|nr:MAG: hypothetical protein B7Y41_04570 [Hydrogenophilales bacterium 28-61-23]
MSNTLIGLLVFFLVAGLFFYLIVLDAGRWRKKIEAALLPIGFEACAAEDVKSELAQRLQIVNTRKPGKRLLMHLYRRSAPDGLYEIYVCDYRFGSASGKARGGQSILVCLVSKALDLPRISIESVLDASGLAGKIFQKFSDTFPLPGMEIIETGDMALDQRFRVYASAGQARNISPFVKRISSALRSKGGVCLDAANDGLILSSLEMGADLVRHEVDPQKLLQLIHVGIDLYEMFRRPYPAGVAEH